MGTSVYSLERGGRRLVLRRAAGRLQIAEAQGVSDFSLRVYRALLDVPRGETVTYGELARRIGCSSAQAVGQVLRRNPFAPEIPCHRVVAADGSLRGYGGSRTPRALARKRELLREELVRAYIFDMDGTLVDNCAYHVTAWQAFSKAHGNMLSKRDILDWMGAQGSFYIEKIVGRALPPDEVARLCAEKEVIYRKIYRPQLPDGLRAWLDRAHLRGIACAVATGGPRENVDFVLDALGLRDDFDVIVDGSMYTHSKPDPECFLKAAARMGVEPSACCVYEDAVNGIGAARAAGMDVVAITFTNARKTLESAGANRVIDSYRELLPTTHNFLSSTLYPLPTYK